MGHHAHITPRNLSGQGGSTAVCSRARIQNTHSHIACQSLHPNRTAQCGEHRASLHGHTHTIDCSTRLHIDASTTTHITSSGKNLGTTGHQTHRAQVRIHRCVHRHGPTAGQQHVPSARGRHGTRRRRQCQVARGVQHHIPCARDQARKRGACTRKRCSDRIVDHRHSIHSHRSDAAHGHA